MKILVYLLLLFPSLVWSQTCEQNQVKLQVLGSGGPELTDGRVSSSHLIWVDGGDRIFVYFGCGHAQKF
jgi:hypothetical protein